MAVAVPISARFRGPTLLVKNRDTVVEVDIEQSAAAPTTTAVNFSLFDSGGTALISSAAASDTAGTLAYTGAAADTASQSMGIGYMVRFEATIGGVEYRFSNNCAVCLQEIYCPIGTSDLTNRFTKLADLQPSGAASNLQKYVTDAWVNLTTRMYSGGLSFWTIRSPGHLREWLTVRALSYCLADLALVLGNGGPFRDEARRMEKTLPGLYEKIRSLLDTSEDNTTSAVRQSTAGVIQLTSGR